ncbi:MAG: General L-amino acid-binding periplasmic protein AapJ precursor [Alphaproteobacteria bacterium ADurb.Bin438]|nr:MAG: General L-amino acid-binding periplasmic protein AapJ precursor [Alphaproteobacteria bacterium ADurb.Bin438]
MKALLFILFISFFNISLVNSKELPEYGPDFKQLDYETIYKIKDRGYLKCGVSYGLTGLSIIDDSGDIKGFYSDLCRAISAGFLGSKNLVEFIEISSDEDIFLALKDEEIDVFSGPVNWTMKLYVGNDTLFSSPMYYDERKILVHANNKNKSIKEILKLKICSMKGTSTDLEIYSYLGTDKIKLNIDEYYSYSQLVSSFAKKDCQVLIQNNSVLKSIMKSSGLSENDYYIAPFSLNKMIISPIVSNFDVKWWNLVNWVLNLLIYAEEKGIGIDNIKNYSKEEIKQIFNVNDDYIDKMMLNRDFIYDIISQVGNYKEIYNRNILKELKIERGSNTLYKDGGDLYSPSF